MSRLVFRPVLVVLTLAAPSPVLRAGASASRETRTRWIKHGRGRCTRGARTGPRHWAQALRGYGAGRVHLPLAAAPRGGMDYADLALEDLGKLLTADLCPGKHPPPSARRLGAALDRLPRGRERPHPGAASSPGIKQFTLADYWAGGPHRAAAGGGEPG